MKEADVVKVKTAAINPGESLVLPDEFRRGLGLDQGGEFTIIQLNGLVLVTPKRLASSETLENIRQILGNRGTTLDDLLEGLAQTRQEIYDERYGRSPQAGKNLP